MPQREKISRVQQTKKYFSLALDFHKEGSGGIPIMQRDRADAIRYHASGNLSRPDFRTLEKTPPVIQIFCSDKKILLAEPFFRISSAFADR